MSSSNAANNNQHNDLPVMMSDNDAPPAPAVRSATAQSSLFDHHAALSSMFSNLLDNLAAKMAPPSAVVNPSSAPVVDGDNKPAAKNNIRRTSDLLETLQKALAAPPPLSRVADKDAPCFVATVEIINAMHIARMSVHRNRQHAETTADNSCQQQQQTIEQDPDCYVTFKARHVEPLTPGVITSPDGQVFATAVMPRSTCPEWQQKFDKVMLPEELLSNVS